MLRKKTTNFWTVVTCTDNGRRRAAEKCVGKDLCALVCCSNHVPIEQELELKWRASRSGAGAR